MGTVNSIFKINGKVGDFVYYQLNGKQVMRHVAKKKKGPKTAAQQIVVKQNTEFGKASSSGKFLRTALSEECKRLNDRYLYRRVTKLMLGIKSYDPAPQGLRTVGGGLATDEGKQLFAHFRFHKKSGSFTPLSAVSQREGRLDLNFFPAGKAAEAVIELQLDFGTGKFRKHLNECTVSAQQELRLKKQFRRKKGFTDLVLILGEGFLQGAVVGNEGLQENISCHSLF